MKYFKICFFIQLFVFSSLGYARNDVGDYSIEKALSSEVAKLKIGSDVKFYFAEQQHASVLTSLGSVKTNKKTNAFNKSDLQACEWVFLSAMITLKNSAIKKGANAIVNIQSNYKNNLSASETTFQCGAGTFVAGVALVGDLVILK